MFTLLPETKSSILVVGDIMLDRYWLGDALRISPEAPVPVVHMQNSEDRLGGAANVAHNIAMLSAHVGLLGIVGCDDNAECIRALLKKDRIQLHLCADEEVTTIVKLRVIARKQQLLRIDFEKPLAEHLLKNIHDTLLTSFEPYSIIVFSDYAKGSLQDVKHLIQIAKQANKKIIVDPKGNDFSRYRDADVLTPNKSEIKAIIGEWRSEAELAAKTFRLMDEISVDNILLTRSEEGISLFSQQDGEHNVIHIPAHAHDVYDVSGAGDTVVATLAVMLADGFTLPDAAEIANHAAGIVVTKFGTATVSRAELQNSLNLTHA